MAVELEIDRCPYCNVDTPTMKHQASFQSANHSKAKKWLWEAYACNRCGAVVFTGNSSETGVGNVAYTSKITIPEVQAVSKSIPNPARSFLQQAKDSIHTAPSGSIMVSASAIDSMLKFHGYPNGKLYSRIEKACKDHLITDGMKKWAHQVRLDANAERHADEKRMPNSEDAQMTYNFASALGDFLFVIPTMVEEGIEESKSEGMSGNDVSENR